MIIDTQASQRQARLLNRLSGTNLALAGDFNQRIVLQQVRLKPDITRPDLVAITGLTMPTILAITRKLEAAGLIRESGRTSGGRGQPASRYRVAPSGAFGLGLSIDRSGLTLALVDLSGETRNIWHHRADFLLPDQVAALIPLAIKNLLGEAEVSAERDDPFIAERLIGLGIAMPDDLAQVQLPGQPSAYSRWADIDPLALMRPCWNGPLHIDNDAAAAAIGEAHFGMGQIYRHFFYILVSAGLGGSLVLDGMIFRGATGRSGELGFLPVGRASLQDVVSRRALDARLQMIDTHGDAAENAITQWLEDAADALAGPVVAINCLINPEAIVLAGDLDKTLALRLLTKLRQRVQDNSPAPLGARADIVLGQFYEDAAARGAAMLPFIDQLLPSEANLMKKQA
ncbi:ROK family protein [Novosphingobium umbonatum]|uniref:ROK family protein n=1 Tax=Novosphingobium umbonatum TaxID=1908524 RepID=A0A437MXE1_9SPHN|nr:ROK family protein [Novosphingobium umbonatum]RVU02318.1 ROK family protein [Novosphingobium umbonatum]